MTRSHRLAHRLVWPALALATVLLFAAALVLRPLPQQPAPPQPQEQAK